MKVDILSYLILKPKPRSLKRIILWMKEREYGSLINRIVEETFIYYTLENSYPPFPISFELIKVRVI